MNLVRLAAAGFNTEETEYGAAEYSFFHCVDGSANFFLCTYAEYKMTRRFGGGFLQRQTQVTPSLRTPFPPR